MGGAHPKTMLNVGNALVNSRIHYSTIPTKLNKQNANTIQILLNKCYRICMGYIKTTPVNVILFETCKLPFYYKMKSPQPTFYQNNYTIITH